MWIFAATMVVALGIFGRTVYRRVGVLLKAGPDDRFDNIPERVKNVLVYAFAQKKFVQSEPRPGTAISERTAGWMHFFIFWGFTILAIQVVHMFVRGFVDDFYLPPFSPGLLGGPYLLVKDVMEVIVLVCVAVALYRWLLSHPKRLYGFKPAEDRLAQQSHWEAILILCFIATIMISGKLYDGGRMVFEASNPHVQAEMARQVPQRRRVVDPQRRHSGLLEPAAPLQALPHLDLHPQRVLRQDEAQRAAEQTRSGELAYLRDLLHQPVLVETGPRHVFLHRVRTLLFALPGDDERQAAGAPPADAQLA
jgi:hypothetical protein